MQDMNEIVIAVGRALAHMNHDAGFCFDDEEDFQGIVGVMGYYLREVGMTDKDMRDYVAATKVTPPGWSEFRLAEHNTKYGYE